MRLSLLIPALLMLSACCGDFTVDIDIPTSVRVNNRTDQAITIRYTTSAGIEHRDAIAAGGHLTFDAWEEADAVKADYRHLIHYYGISDSCEQTIDVDADDFVPAMPVANG